MNSEEGNRADQEATTSSERLPTKKKNRLFTAKGSLVALLVIIFLLFCGPCIWKGIYIPSLTAGDSLDDYIHRRVSITGRYEHNPNDSTPRSGFIYFGNEPVGFHVLPESDLRVLKDGDTISVAGYVLCPNPDMAPPFRHTLTRSTFRKVQ